MRLKDAKIGDWVYISTRHETGWVRVKSVANHTAVCETDRNFRSERYDGEKVIYLPESTPCTPLDTIKAEMEVV